MVRDSRYEERPLVEKFKQGINRMIRRKLMEAEWPSRSVEQWYERTVNLDRYYYWRKSRREKERLRDRRKIGALAQRTNALVIISRV